MWQVWTRQALAGLVLVLMASRLPADGNIVDIDTSKPDRIIVPAAEKEVLLNAGMVAPAPGQDASLAAAFSRLEELMENGLLDEADSAAKQLMELVIRSTGPGSAEAARALTNLAIVQHRMQQYDSAVSNYESAIQIIETVEDRLNGQLVNPLKGLASAHLDRGRPDLASDTYRRAVHITHVNEGPYNPSQMQILHDLSNVQLMMGNLEEAAAIQDTIYSIDIRNHGVGTLEVVPAMMRRAQWQHDAGQIIAERTTYREAIRVIEKQLGNDHVALVDPLVQLGRSFFYQDSSGDSSFHKARLSSAEIYLKRAVRIAGNQEQPDWRVLANATLSLGDFYMFDNSPLRARQVYRGVWNLLSEDEGNADKLRMRQEELERPIVLRQQPLPNRIGDAAPALVPGTDDPVHEGLVTVRFAVSERGLTGNIELVEANPPEFGDMVEAVKSELRRRIYRPRVADGEPVATQDQVLSHTYAYRQSHLDELRETVASADAAGT